MELEDGIKGRLSGTLRVLESRCEEYHLVYRDIILPRVEEQFLAHLISAVEDLIFEKIREAEPHARRYRIILFKNNPKNGKAAMRSWRYGAIISYNPNNDRHDLRIYIAHELGHLLCQYKILGGGSTDSHANLLAYFAIVGKNSFYKDVAPSLVYRGGELEIISRIQAVCPIT